VVSNPPAAVGQQNTVQQNTVQQATVANAPVSYGAFEITIGHDPNGPDGISVLDQVAAAG
jgi:hypothetical protein